MNTPPAAPRRALDTSNLDPRFTPYYLTGERVEVILPEGYGGSVGYSCRPGKENVWRFYVGRSTGHRPTYIMLLQRNSTGGSAISPTDPIVSIRGLGTYLDAARTRERRHYR